MLRPPRRPLAYASAVSWVSTSPLAGVPCPVSLGYSHGLSPLLTEPFSRSACCWPWVSRTHGLFGEPPSERIITFVSLRSGGSPKGSRPFGCLRGWHGDSHQPDQCGKEGNPSNGLGGGFHPRPPVPSPATGETFAVSAWSRYGEEVCECHGFVLRGSRIS